MLCQYMVHVLNSM